MVRAGLQPTGHFQERYTDLEGVEVARLGCSAPTAILPVTFGNLELPPDELSYRDGNYNVAYAFDGHLYSARWISYKLRVMDIWRRLTSLVSDSDSKRLHYYMKIWTPVGCQGLTLRNVERLRDAD